MLVWKITVDSIVRYGVPGAGFLVPSKRRRASWCGGLGDGLSYCSNFFFNIFGHPGSP